MEIKTTQRNDNLVILKNLKCKKPTGANIQELCAVIWMQMSLSYISFHLEYILCKYVNVPIEWKHREKSILNVTLQYNVNTSLVTIKCWIYMWVANEWQWNKFRDVFAKDWVSLKRLTLISIVQTFIYLYCANIFFASSLYWIVNRCVECIGHDFIVFWIIRCIFVLKGTTFITKMPIYISVLSNI